jgi:putative addiction module component (TIGR02574 family)
LSLVAHPLFDFSHLNVAQRIELALALWDSLPDDSAEPPLTDAQRNEIARRLEAYRHDPDSGREWGEVRERIRQRSYKKPDR